MSAPEQRRLGVVLANLGTPRCTDDHPPSGVFARVFMGSASGRNAASFMVAHS
jgi:hypothetical protein